MTMFIIGLVVGIIVTALFIFATSKAQITASDGCREIKKNPSTSKIKPPLTSNYKGLPEVEWNGKLPAKVDDYVRPRYVYENLVESEKLDFSQGHIIGYRISPTLVIHSMIGKNYESTGIADFIGYYKGHLLSYPEAQILLSCWDTVDNMRKKAGDAPLPIGPFWIWTGLYNQLVSPHQPYLHITQPLRTAGIVMKR